MAALYRVKCILCDTQWVERGNGTLDTNSVLETRFSMIGHNSTNTDVVRVCSVECARVLLTKREEAAVALGAIKHFIEP